LYHNICKKVRVYSYFSNRSYIMWTCKRLVIHVVKLCLMCYWHYFPSNLSTKVTEPCFDMKYFVLCIAGISVLTVLLHYQNVMGEISEQDRYEYKYYLYSTCIVSQLSWNKYCLNQDRYVYQINRSQISSVLYWQICTIIWPF